MNRTTADLLEAKIQEKAASINDLIRLGWEREAAIAHERACSTLGPVAWERVLALVAA